MKQVRNSSPRFLKLAYRYIKYKNERLKQSREKPIKRIQDSLLKSVFNGASQNLIVFLVPGADWESGLDKVSGGVISIVSICEQTTRLKELHNADVILCTMREDHLFLKHTMFENETPVFRFEQLSVFFQQVKNIMFHVPEFLVSHFIGSLNKTDWKWLEKAQIHLNILNQNISLMPSSGEMNSVKHYFPRMTITTAHQKYCTSDYRQLYGIPIHKFSVWISPEQYEFRDWHQKENLIVVSPDKHEYRDRILDLLKGIPELKVQVIQNLTYEEYKKLITRAKWSLTFGEGLDGYFIEPVFSGAIGFAVFNEEFFTRDFKDLPTVFDSYEDLKAGILTAIYSLDKAVIFAEKQKLQFELCAKYYSKQVYLQNIKLFYQGQYTFP